MHEELLVSNYILPELTQTYIKKDGMYFYYGSNLKIFIGNSYIVFGDIFSYDNSHSVQRGLDMLDGSDLDVKAVEQELYYWGGRFVLYYKKQFFMDCCGLLGLFYFNGNNRWIITSSMKLLSNDIGFNTISNAPSFNWGQFINYFPLPKTMLSDVMKLDNIYGLEIGEDGVSPFMRHTDSVIQSEDIESLCEKIKVAFGCFINDLRNEYGNHIALELTAGVDSRFNLAMLMTNDCKPATYSHYTPNFKRYDMSMPKKISKILGLEYTFYGRKCLRDFSQDMQSEYDQQVCFSVDDGDRYTYSHGLNIFDQSWVVLRNGIYESLIFYEEHNFSSFHGRQEFINQIEKLNHGLNENVKTSLELWLDRFDEREIYKSSDFLNKFHMEQKNGGSWSSYIELGNELKNFTTIHPSNCAYLLDLLRAFPDDMKNMEKGFQKYLIKRVDERLASLPYNFSYWEKGKTKLKKVIKRMLPKKD